MFDASDIQQKGRRLSMARGKPSKGTGKDRRLKRNKGKKKKRR